MIIFRYRRQKSLSFGEILRPIADAILEFNGSNRIEVPMYIDSGADITLIPFTLGRALGLQEMADEIRQMKVISGSVPYVVKTITMFLNNHRIEARIAWSMTENVPPLLGRMDIFHRFKILFDERQEEIRFE